MICTNCQINAAISEQNYGALYTCSGCQAVYFINFEGQPEFGEVASEENAAENSSEAESLVFSGAVEPVESIEVLESFSAIEEPIQTFNNNEFTTENNGGSEPVFQTLIDSTDVLSFDNKPEPQQFSSVAQEISNFGNTETQLAGLNYDLKITGLDTHEIKKLFQEAIADSKFAWDVTEIMRSIRNGQIEFQKLSPVKAYILAKRLQFLDIEKQWRQNAMS